MHLAALHLLLRTQSDTVALAPFLTWGILIGSFYGLCRLVIDILSFLGRSRK